MAGEPPRALPAVLVMARAPLPGRVKTRLEPRFTRAECAAIQGEMIRRTARWAIETAAPGAAFLAYDPPEARRETAALLPPGFTLIEQHGEHLGERLQNATAHVAHAAPGRPLLVVGVDTRLARAHADEALSRLEEGGAQVAFGPARDGGYYLAALAALATSTPPPVFDIEPSEWGGPNVLAASLEAAAASNLRAAVLETEETDLDTAADAESLLQQEPAGTLSNLLRAALTRPLVSIVVPARDEAGTIHSLLDHIAALDGRFETIVVDGGSTDGTAARAREHRSAPHVIETEPGRARQLNTGASASHGDPIVFLHADSRLPPDAYRSLTRTRADGGNFAIRFEGDDLFAKVLGIWYRAQRRLGVYYGDSAIWLRRAAFEALGGFQPLPIMDDYDLARRLEKRFATVCLPGPVVTSARRWRALGVPRTVLSWVLIRWLFLAGMPPERLASLYRRVR